MLNKALISGGITSKAQVIHFLAQISHESSDFKFMNELGPKNQDARTYFNSKYSTRKDLGNLGGDDGYNYRGFGAIQLTGRANF